MAELSAPEIDRTLANLVAVIDTLSSRQSDGPGVTLTLSGLVLSGRVITRWQWFDEVEHASRASFTVHAGGSIDDEHGGWASLFRVDHESAVRDRDEYLSARNTIQNLPERYQRRIEELQPQFIHLSETRVFTSAHSSPLPASGMHWRGRLSEVWSSRTGRCAPVDPPSASSRYGLGRCQGVGYELPIRTVSRFVCPLRCG